MPGTTNEQLTEMVLRIMQQELAEQKQQREPGTPRRSQVQPSDKSDAHPAIDVEFDPGTYFASSEAR